MVIVGIHGNDFCFKDDGSLIFAHDSSVTLVVDGQLIGALSQDRITREKYDGSWPVLSLTQLLERNGLVMTDVDVFAYTGNNYNGYPVHAEQVSRACAILSPRARVEHYDHHLAHAMASFLSSNFDRASIFTFDNSGDYQLYGAYHNNATYMQGARDPLDLIKIYNSRTPSWGEAAMNFFQGTFNLGFFYDVMSRACLQIMRVPIRHISECPGKVMGLGAYGDRSAIGDVNPFVTTQITPYDFPEILWNPMVTGEFNQWMDKMCQHRAEDVAAWTQWVFEETMIDFFKKIPANMRQSRICLGGGCALNIVLNSRLIREGLFEDVHVNTAPNDAGLSFGCALLSASRNEPRLILPDNIGTIGLSYTNEEALKAYQQHRSKLHCHRLPYEQMIAEVARRLERNEIVAWFQGASEFGPRALGNRSILANPCHDNRELLNTKVKNREHWRPYAAVILQTQLNDWVDCPKQHSDYMLFAAEVHPHRRQQIPAVVHRDGSCRVQTVEPHMNQRLFDVMTEFHRLTQVPMLLNTSFNTLPGEPIVESPEDAFRSFMHSQIDCMVINDCLFTRCNTEKITYQ